MPSRCANATFGGSSSGHHHMAVRTRPEGSQVVYDDTDYVLGRVELNSTRRIEDRKMHDVLGLMESSSLLAFCRIAAECERSLL